MFSIRTNYVFNPLQLSKKVIIRASNPLSGIPWHAPTKRLDLTGAQRAVWLCRHGRVHSVTRLPANRGRPGLRRVFGRTQLLGLSSREIVDAERFNIKAIAAGLFPISNCVCIIVRSSILSWRYIFPMQHYLPKMLHLVFWARPVLTIDC